MDKLNEVCGDIFSAIVAILRLLFLTCVMFASALHLILFAQLEITNVELRGMAWRSRREKDMRTLSFIDHLCIENPDLLDYAEDQMSKDNRDLPPYPDEDEGDSEI